ncbi:unnamed protein product [Phytophthora lilii]|uniref:Unnamed protein product n=1 Tax=Phytophthora lilii TaxID=2077276 RepID=A0A9W6YK43_9STRA|nr:unnamed protein product [Phytophthora lilii]
MVTPANRYQYEIHDIAGDDNVWADLLLRWGSSFRTVCAIRQVPLPLSPQLEENFVWTTMKAIFEVQNDATPPKDIKRSTTDLLLRDERGRIWIPDDAVDMQMRICVVGHFGIAGHRGMKVTLQQIKAKFVWTNMAKDADFLCVAAYTALARLVVLHSHDRWFVWLIPSKTADADTTFSALLNWFASFGVCRYWVSDQGTHFKNAVIEGMQHALGAHHHFTTTRCPWANGTVEVVMRETLRCCRALLSEWRLQPREWPRVIKVVQLVLNNTPSLSLGGVAPVTAMTELSAMGPSDHIAIPGPVELATLGEIQTVQRANVVKLQQALEMMHKRTATINSAVRAAERKGHDKASKLRVNWCGPAQVVATTLNWIFEVRNLVTGQQKEVHASRLKFYFDRSLDFSEDLLLHIAHNSEGHIVDSLLEARYHRTEKRHELKVHWRAFDSIEDSWEPAATLIRMYQWP